MKTVYIFAGIALVAIAGVLVWRNTGDTPDTDSEIVASLSPTPATTPTPTSTPTGISKQTPTPIKGTPKPTPGIIITEEGSYEAWVKWLDPLNRWLALDKDCTSIVPSQVDYPNNVEIMLDNSASAEARVLKIGSQEYRLNAHSWIVTTLHAESLPAKLTMFCGNMELGQLDLLAK